MDKNQNVHLRYLPSCFKAQVSLDSSEGGINEQTGQIGANTGVGPQIGKVRQCLSMDHFPEFMKHPSNRIMQSNQVTPGVEGYVFDGVDGSQMAFWTCSQDAASAEHLHDYDEYILVVRGCYTLIINRERIPVKAGGEYLIPRGVPHSGEVRAGTRTIHAFGRHRVSREQTKSSPK